jgi:hypothetical protein
VSLSETSSAEAVTATSSFNHSKGSRIVCYYIFAEEGLTSMRFK